MEQRAVKFYTRRWRYLPAALMGSLFAIVGATTFLGENSHGMRDILIGIGCVAVGMLPVLLGLYYLFTPIPLLSVDQIGMSFQKHPFVVERVRWEDVEAIRTYRPRTYPRFLHRRDTELWLNMTFTPQAAVAYRNQRWMFWRFTLADQPAPPEAIVEQIRRFHAVKYVDQYEGSQ